MSGPKAMTSTPIHAEPDEGVIVEPSIGTRGRNVSREAPRRLHVAGLTPIQSDVAALHLEPAEQHRRVRIALDVGVGVVLAVNSDPLPRPDSRRDPHQEPKDLGHRPLERDRSMSQTAVQEHRRRHECDAGHAETDQQTEGGDP